MANELDELNAVVNENGRDINVIEKQIKVSVGKGSTIFEVLLWVLGIIPGVIFLFRKIKAKEYLDKVQQKLQHNASTVDNYLEQRVVVLQNAAKLVDKAIKLDKETYTEIAKLRSGKADEFTTSNAAIEHASRAINVQIEKYPELQAHKEIADAMQQNSYLQKEITAAREVYNDTVNEWNRAIFVWPAQKIVAAKNGYTTRIPFSVSKETKKKAKEVFF